MGKTKTGPCNNGNLFTPVMREYIRKGTQMGQYFQMHPFVWRFRNKEDKQGNIHYVTDFQNPSKYPQLRLYVWHFNMWLTFAYSAFVGVRCYQTIQDEIKTNAQKVYMQFITVYFLWPAGFQLVAYIVGPAFPAFVRGYMQFFEACERTFLDTSADKEVGHSLSMIRICEILMINCYRCFNCITVLMVIGLYLRPHSPEHLSSLVSEPESLNRLQKIPFLIFLGYIEVMFHAHCFVFFLPGIASVLPTLVCLQKLNDSIRTLSKSTGFKRLQRIFSMYNAISILVINVNEVYSAVTIPLAKLSLIIFIIICTYCGIRMEGLVGITLGFIGLYSFIFLIVLFGLLSLFHTRSSALLVLMRTFGYRLCMGIGPEAHAQKMYFKQVVRSLRPVKINVNSCYFVDKDMVLTMVDRVVEETVSFLLANP